MDLVNSISFSSHSTVENEKMTISQFRNSSSINNLFLKRKIASSELNTESSDEDHSREADDAGSATNSPQL
jgi:hypothetical protein